MGSSFSDGTVLRMETSPRSGKRIASGKVDLAFFEERTGGEWRMAFTMLDRLAA